MSENYEQQSVQQVQPSQQVVIVQQTQPEMCGFCIAGFITSFFVSITSIILSLVGIRKCKTEGLRGKGLAIAGIVISSIRIAIVVIYLTLFLIASMSYTSMANQAQEIAQQGVNISATDVNNATGSNTYTGGQQGVNIVATEVHNATGGTAGQ